MDEKFNSDELNDNLPNEIPTDGDEPLEKDSTAQSGESTKNKKPFSFKAFFNKKCNEESEAVKDWKAEVHDFLKALNAHPAIVTFIWAFLTNFLVECFNQRSAWVPVKMIFTNPLIFLLNTMMIMFTLCFGLMLRHRYFFYSLISTLWTVMGVTCFVIQSNRWTPFEATDLNIFFNGGLDITLKYMKVYQIVLIVLAIIAVIALLVYLFIKIPKVKVTYIKNLIKVACISGAFFLILNVYYVSGVLPQRIADDLHYAYKDYGLCYCFSLGLFDKGVSKPDDYSETKMTDIYDELSATPDNDVQKKPNVVIVQLESFFDMHTVKDLKFSEDPIPTYTNLEKTCASGNFIVPSIGAGTANTEFEVLTGMNLKYFGAGEYPYKTIMLDSTCESIPNNLKELGYSSHAIHNHTGSFYSRDVVYQNMGFDSFTPVEYMSDVDRNAKDWAKDGILTEQIMDSLKSTENEDFVFTVSVQCHGQYPTEPIDEENQTVSLTSGYENDPEMQSEWNYFINQAKETDEFVKNLTDALSNYDEDTVVVFYGDHIPYLNIQKDELAKGQTQYMTQYVVWTNYKTDADFNFGDIHSYQLSANVLKALGMNNGILTKVHQNYKKSDDYQNILNDLEYDMLYGNKYVYGGTNPFKASDMRFGVKDITIEGLEYSPDGLTVYVYGQNFTEKSRVLVNDSEVSTKYESRRCLSFDADELDTDEVNSIQVAQRRKADSYFSVTPEEGFAFSASEQRSGDIPSDAQSLLSSSEITSSTDE